MTHGLSLELARQANTIARAYHSDFYCSVHEAVADLPAEPEHTGGPFFTRAVRVHFAHLPRRVHLLTAESVHDDEHLLGELQKTLNTWAAADAPPHDALFVTEEHAARLLRLATHSLTAPAERVALLGKYLRWQTEKEAAALTANLTAKIEARSPGVLTGRGWMPHGPAEAKPSPNPFAAA